MANKPKVFRTAQCLSETRFGEVLGAGWARVGAKMTRAAFAEAAKVVPETISNAISGKHLPKGHTIFNSLAADPTALDEVLAEYGIKGVPLVVDAANDLHTAAGTINAMAALVKSQDDHNRDHNETLAIAELLRPHLPALNGIVADADRLRA